MGNTKMGTLQAMHTFYGSEPLPAIALTLLVFSWLAGKQLSMWRSLQTRLPLFIALLELFLAPLAVILFFALLRIFLSRFPVLATDKWLPALFHLSLSMTVSWYVARGGYAFLGRRHIGEQYAHSQSVPGLLRGLLYASSLLVGAGVFFWVEGYSLTGVWISTGLATALIGFALQQTLGDFFSGVALSLEGCFRIGDWLRLENDTEGQIIDINWRATWLRCWDNTTLVIPNAKLAAQGFKNLHSDDHPYRPWYYVKVPAEVDPRFAKELLFKAAFNCKYILKHPAPIVRLVDASTLPYTYMVWVSFANYPTMFKGREELYREIHYILKRAGVAPAAEIHEWRTRRSEIPTAEPPTIELALKSQDLFSSLTDEEIKEIALASRQLHYDTGCTILQEGDCRDSLDIVISGVVESGIQLPNGKQIRASELAAGEYFGLISMFTDQPSLFGYSAQTDVTLIRVDIDCMREVLRKHPDLAERYAAIIKQRLDEAELLHISNVPAQPSSNTLLHINKLIKQLIRKG
jgi:small-conductance mechanosensitive channel